jgi:hypothetical protein
MDHQRAAREAQLAIWLGWTPARRLHAASELTSFALAQRDRWLRIRHPGASEDEMRRLRVEATLAASPTLNLP